MANSSINLLIKENTLSSIDSITLSCIEQYIRNDILADITYEKWYKFISVYNPLYTDTTTTRAFNISNNKNILTDSVSGNKFSKRDIMISPIFSEILEQVCSEKTRNTGMIKFKIITKQTRNGIREFYIINIYPTPQYIKDIEKATNIYVTKCIEQIKSNYTCVEQVIEKYVYKDTDFWLKPFVDNLYKELQLINILKDVEIEKNSKILSRYINSCIEQIKIKHICEDKIEIIQIFINKCIEQIKLKYISKDSQISFKFENFNINNNIFSEFTLVSPMISDDMYIYVGNYNFKSLLQNECEKIGFHVEINIIDHPSKKLDDYRLSLHVFPLNLTDSEDDYLSWY